MVMSLPLLATSREFDLGTRRFLRLLREDAHHDDPAADRRDVKRAGNSIAACQPLLPQLSFKVLHMRFAQALQPDRCDAFGEPQKPRLQVGRKGGNLSGDGFVEDFDSPGHISLYLNFEIKKRGKKVARMSQRVALMRAMMNSDMRD
jgi:hypothetical protein